MMDHDQRVHLSSISTLQWSWAMVISISKTLLRRYSHWQRTLRSQKSSIGTSLMGKIESKGPDELPSIVRGGTYKAPRQCWFEAVTLTGNIEPYLAEQNWDTLCSMVTVKAQNLGWNLPKDGSGLSSITFYGLLRAGRSVSAVNLILSEELFLKELLHHSAVTE